MNSAVRAWLLATTAGVVLALGGFIMGGAGHGTFLPLLLFNGPIGLLRPLVERRILPEVFFWPLLVGTPLLYALYALALSRDRRRGHGWRTLVFIFLLHYGSFAITAVELNEGSKYLMHTWDAVPTILAGSILVFVLLHVAIVLWLSRGSRVIRVGT